MFVVQHSGLSIPKGLSISCDEWPSNSSRIVSLYDIVKPFTAGRYLIAINAVGDLVGTLERVGNRFDGERLKDTLKSFPSAFETLKRDCQTLEIAASFATVEKILAFFKQEDLAKFRAEPLQALLHEFRGRMADELKARECFLLSLSEAHHYKEPRKGWESIIARFPNTATDIEEASKCLALSRYIAAVFHSLQVVELGLIELGTFIGVNDPLSGWTAVSQRLKRIIDTKYQDRTEREKENSAFFEQVQGTVEALKNAWRNKVNHAHGKLTLMAGEDFHPDIAEEILFATRAFMRRLAEGLPPLQSSQ